MKQPKKILIVRTDRIGDIILTLPMATVLKKYFKNVHVSFLIREYTNSLVENHPDVDEVILLKEENGKPNLIENINQLKNKNFDSAIVVNPSFFLALLLFFSKIPLRIGTGYRLYSFLFNKKIYVHRKTAEKHELEYNIQMLNQLGINENIEQNKINFTVPINEQSLKKIEQLFNEYKINSNNPIVIFHPGSGGSAVDLPLSKMKELINFVASNLNYQVVLTGSNHEIKLCNDLIENEKIINFAGKCTLEDLTALISKAKIFVGNSTGPLHIAAALNKTVIGFYPNVIVCSPKRWGPYTDKKFIFTPDCDKINCTVEKCLNINCMNTINIKDVVDILKSLEENHKG